MSLSFREFVLSAACMALIPIGAQASQYEWSEAAHPTIAHQAGVLELPVGVIQGQTGSVLQLPADGLALPEGRGANVLELPSRLIEQIAGCWSGIVHTGDVKVQITR